MSALRAHAGPPAAYLWLASACGFVWGLLAMLIAYPDLQTASMGGFALAPLSGWLLARLGWACRGQALLARLAWCLAAVYLAALLFGLGCGALQLLLSGAPSGVLAVLVRAVRDFTLALTLAGWPVLLWPLCFAVQSFLWRVGSTTP